MRAWISLFCVTLVIGQTLRLPGGVLATDLVVIMLLVNWVVHLIRSKTCPKYPVIQTGLLLLLMLWGSISMLFNLHTLPRNEFVGPAAYLVRTISYLALYFPLTDWYQKRPQKYFQIWEKSLYLTTLSLILLGYIQLIFIPDFSFMAQYGWDPHQGRLLSTWYDPNFLAGYLSLVSPIFISHVLEDYRQKTVSLQTALNGFLGIMIFIAMILTLSRSGLLAYMTSTMIVVLIYSPWGLVTLGNVLSAILLINERFRQRVLGIFQIDVTASLRIESWMKTINDIEQSPWIGVGYNTLRYQNLMTDTLNSGSGRDSSLLTIWLTTGIVGLMLVIFLIVDRIRTFLLMAQSSHPRFRQWGVSGIASLSALLVHSMFVNSMTYVHILSILMIYLSIQYDKTTSNS